MARSELFFVAALALAGCGEPMGPGPLDGGRRVDAQSGEPDGATRADGATPAGDSGPLVPADAAPAGRDAGPPSAACDGSVGMRTRSMRVSVGGMMRTFAVHLPPAYDGTAPLPVVLNFHGRNSNASQQNLVSGMDTFADGAGFIAVHPEGVGMTWNGGLCCGEAMSRGIDDVAFTRAMLDAIEAELCVDATRVYATGLSNGGFMSHRLACELSDRIAAIAPVAGTNVAPSCTPPRAMPVFHFHGTADTIVPYGGFGGIASVDDTMAGWVTRNGCGATPTVLSSGEVSCREWRGCRDGATVRLCAIEGGGHQWPGGFTIPGLGYNTSEISATEEMWSFFQLHSL